MNHAAFEWDYDNISHIARHGVTPEEAEDVVLFDPIDLGDEFIEGEWRFSSLGATRFGRVLLVVATFRGPRIRVVSSYAPGARLVREFLLSRSESER